ncbi:MAG TPA: tol-pal system protein YbgF [Xanthobacteraceae bacterium]|nr:tol-pal system protein YbgF [Xanthobacteraceae bacterium]
MIRVSASLKRNVVLACAALAVLSVGPAASAQESAGLFGSLFGGSDRTHTAQAEEGRTAVAQMSGADLIVRLERLENQVRQLTGAIEQLQFRNQQLEQQLKRNQEDVDYRFQELGGKAPPSRPRSELPVPPPASAPPPASEPRRRSDVFDPREHPDAPGAPRALGASAAPGAPAPIAVEEPIGAPGGRPAGAPLDLSTLAARAAADPALGSGAAVPQPAQGGAAGPLPPPPTSNPNATGAQRMVMMPANSPKEEFAIAQAFIQQKDYAMAESAFREFLKKHPNDRLAAEANYWLGESLYQRQRYRDAAEAFLTVSTKHDNTAKAPEALLRLGQSLAALGEKEASCATLAEVLRKFPKATAVRHTAEREQKRVHC